MRDSGLNVCTLSSGPLCRTQGRARELPARRLKVDCSDGNERSSFASVDANLVRLTVAVDFGIFRPVAAQHAVGVGIGIVGLIPLRLITYGAGPGVGV